MKKYFEELYSLSAKNMRASEIRELLKLLNKPEMISFAGGLPNPDVFPLDGLQKVICHVIEAHGRDSLQYGATEGHNKLRDVLAGGMKTHYGVSDQGVQNVIITNGSQQGLNLLSQIFLNPGDKVITSNPTYLGAILTFNSYRADIEPVSIDKYGINLDLLEEKLKKLGKRNELPKFMYLIPTFQNPTGVTIPLERRKRLYEILSRYDILLIEDDPYGLLRYEGEAVPPVKQFDTEGRVVYLGSFSKILAPGFRIGWMVAPEEIVNKVCIAKQAQDLCTNTFGQYCVFEAIHHDLLFPHIEQINRVYKKKRDIMLESMSEYFPKEVRWNKPEGGLFIWVMLPEYCDSLQILTKAIENNVAYVIGQPFFPTRSGHNTFRLNFSYCDDNTIREGVKRLASVLQEEIQSQDELKDEIIDSF